jgi:EPS-associated MarR family transcriptional regulator
MLERKYLRLREEGVVAPASPSIPTTHQRPGPDAVHLDMLRCLADRPELSQRELSLALGISLGKAHYLLHALLDKGLIKARNFRRNDRKLSYAYVLTPSGLREKMRLTRAFLRRKEDEYRALRAAIDALRTELDSHEETSVSRGGRRR